MAILSRGQEPKLIGRRLPGDPDDTHSRYIEAEVRDIIVGCLYLPNCNPWPSPKFNYKLRWFERPWKHASKLVKSAKPVLLAGDYNVMPTDLEVYAPERWRDDALFRIEVREVFAALGSGRSEQGCLLPAMTPSPRNRPRREQLL